jgi:acyl-CoA thioesterase FadM
MTDNDHPVSRTSRRLAESAYNSPYARMGAPTPHPNSDPYAPLRSKALITLESMGYDPQTMVERGVFWAEDQDPFGHVMQSQFMQFLGTCFHRVMESYDEFLSDAEYNDMVLAKTVIPVVRKYELSIRRQVMYPDAVSNECVHAAGYGLGLTLAQSLLQHTERTSLSQHVTAVPLHFSRLNSKRS